MDWQRVRAVFEEALDRPDGPLRARYLEDACEKDADLREHVARLLAHHDVEKGFLEPPVTEQTDTDFLSLPAREQGARVGGYLIERVIGVGGMGTIYQALQETPQRRVALKMLTVGVLSPSRARRLHEEAEILARLHHPGIAQVYEAGMHVEGSGSLRREIPWFAMELVQGAVPITDFAREQELSPRAKLALFVEVCDAVHHGHLHGVIHRDIKPENVLVDGSGHPKIIDFGVARVIETDLSITTRLSGTTELAGTLAYMSPEQISGDSRDLDLRTDVYSLGVVLYELLCERLPLDLRRRSLAEVATIVRDQVPPRPGTVRSSLSGDLEWIVMRALEKDRDRRYASAHEFSGDVRRYLEHRPVLARPPSLMYLLRVFARRNRTLVASLGAGMFVLVLAQICLSILAFRADRDARQLSSTNRFLQQILSSPSYAESAEDMKVGWLLDQAAAAVSSEYAEDPAAEAKLRHVIGNSYTSLGRYARAVEELRRAEVLAAELLGPDSADTRIIRGDLGIALAEAGQLEEAEPLLVQIVEAGLASGRGDPAWLWTLGRLARLRNLQGESEAALELAALRLSRSRELLGEGHPLSLSAQGEHAVLLAELGEREEAESELREALAMLLEGHGDAHPLALDLRAKLGASLVERGAYREAELLLRENLDATAAAVGAFHPRAIAARQNLGVLLLRRGVLAEAEELLSTARDQYAAELGDDHPLTLTAGANLGRALMARGRAREAAPLLTSVFEARRDGLGERHPDTLASRLALGRLMLELGSAAAAVEILEPTAAALAEELGPRHPRALEAAGRLGYALALSGRSEEAEQPLREALALAREELGDGSPEALGLCNDLAGVLFDRGATEESIELLRAALVALPEGARGSPEELDLRSNLGMLLARTGSTSEAEELLLETLAAQRELLGEFHDSVRITLGNLARLYLDLDVDLDRRADAEARFREWIEQHRVLLGPTHELTLSEITALGLELMGWDRPRDAEPLFVEALAGAREAHAGTPIEAVCAANLGTCLAAIGRKDEARGLLESGHAGLVEALGPDHPTTREAHLVLEELRADG
jgi:non-specific serine/threonine protein kinase/serine/threonine-protein kinase